MIQAESNQRAPTITYFCQKVMTTNKKMINKIKSMAATQQNNFMICSLYLASCLCPHTCEKIINEQFKYHSKG